MNGSWDILSGMFLLFRVSIATTPGYQPKFWKKNIFSFIWKSSTRGPSIMHFSEFGFWGISPPSDLKLSSFSNVTICGHQEW